MIQLTRRNFLLGVAASGLLVLQPPALEIVKVKKLLVKETNLTTGFIKAYAIGELTRELTPSPYDVSVEDFMLEASVESFDVTSLGTEWRHTMTGRVDWTVEAWIRTERVDLINEVVELSMKANPDTFYRGKFVVTAHYTHFGVHHPELDELQAKAFGLVR